MKMKTRYSPTTGTFYPFGIDYKDLPPDIIEVSQEDYDAAMSRPPAYTFAFDANGSLTISPAPSPSLYQVKVKLITTVDDAVAGVYSGWTRFESEYREREAAAREFIAAGYAGDASVWVMAFANGAGKTAQEAADIIVMQADQLRGALAQLGALRMRKYEVTNAVDEATARAIHDEIMGDVAAISAALK